MKTKIAKKVREKFSLALNENFPQFKEEPRELLFPNWQLFSWKVEEELSFFIYLIFLKGKNKFNIELAWSKDGKFPFDLLTFFPDDEPVNGALRFRISTLWGPRIGEDEWWELEREPSLKELERAIICHERIPRESDEVVAKRIDSKVLDAISKVAKYAIPYFQKVASQHGIKI